MPTSKKYWTQYELLRKIEVDLDLEGEDFVQPEEARGYLIEAVSEAEKIVHGIYEDYFLTRLEPADYIPIIPGTDSYDLPDDIYAHKIRKVFFHDNQQSPTEVVRSKHSRKLGMFTDDRYNATGGSREFNYFIINSKPGEPKLVLSPVPTANGTLDIWYLRNANRLEDETDILDIPEAQNFVMQYVKVRCIEKEIGNPNIQKAVLDLSTLKTQLESILVDMVPDENTQIPMDLSIYMEMS